VKEQKGKQSLGLRVEIASSLKFLAMTANNPYTLTEKVVFSESGFFRRARLSTGLNNDTSEKEISALLSQFRSHSRSDEEIEQDVRNAIKEVRSNNPMCINLRFSSIPLP
jgi:hypothetical protein